MTRFTSEGLLGHRRPLNDVFGAIRRAWTDMAGRRLQRPLENIDDWSDQAEVAFYEDCRSSRCG